jgi:aminoglycoside phosphotransferase (APT) family kinase protein
MREARVLQAIQGQVRAPRVLAVCHDPALIGVPFYVMEKVDGTVIADTLPPELETPRARRAMAEELIDGLVELHALDWTKLDLGRFAKPSGYLERQLYRFTALWQQNRTRSVPAVETAARWLSRNIPESGPATVVHGDYRLGNVAFDLQSPPTLVSIFDWEMSTIGDRLADVGFLGAMWAGPNDSSGAGFGLTAVTRESGFPSRSELVAIYEERARCAVTNANWYIALAMWKLAVVMEGNYSRRLRGMSDDPFLDTVGEGVLEHAEALSALIEGGL